MQEWRKKKQKQNVNYKNNMIKHMRYKGALVTKWSYTVKCNAVLPKYMKTVVYSREQKAVHIYSVKSAIVVSFC